jgi:hypothetical protein
MFDPTKTVETITGAFKPTPALMALVLINLGMGLLIAFLLVRSADSRFKERVQIIKLLDRCLQTNSSAN